MWERACSRMQCVSKDDLTDTLHSRASPLPHLPFIDLKNETNFVIAHEIKYFIFIYQQVNKMAHISL
ncbi:hypothetical protein BFW90_10660 [Pseudomonas fluorescens]|nr:hypothetical protein BFW90_10660 [Pseudomonas fluorescens]